MHTFRLKPIATSLSLLSIAALQLACGGGAEPVDPAQVESALYPQVPAAGEPARSLTQQMEFYGVPGVSIAVVADFELAWAKGYGVADAASGAPVTAETLFQAGAGSQLLAAATAMKLVEAGKLSLDGSVNDSLGDWKLEEPQLGAETLQEFQQLVSQGASSQVTMRHLLSHTAGVNIFDFPGYAADAELPSLAQILDGAAPANTPAVRVIFPPETDFRQSDGGYAVVEQVLADAGGKPYPELAQELVMTPLGMSHSTLEQPLPAARLAAAASGHEASGEPLAGKAMLYPERAASGLWTTATDLAHLALGIQRSARGDSGALLRTESAQEMLAPVRGTAGLGLQIAEPGENIRFGFTASTAGFFSGIIAFPNQGFGAAVMTNSSNGRRLIVEILQSIGRAYGWPSFAGAEVQPYDFSPEQLDQFAGRYGVWDTAILVSRDEGRLLAREVLRTTADSLVPVSEDTFVNQNSTLRITFRRERDGRATAYTFQAQNGGEVIYPLLRDDDLRPTELLVDGRVEEALAAYGELEIGESRLSTVGYELINLGKTEAAVALLEHNAAINPQSANAMDSLADAYLAAGDRERAAETFRKVRELLPDDPGANPNTRGLLDAKARYQLARLEG